MGYQRLVSCLLLLQGERRQTARRLADSLEVSTRTVYRDVEALSAAGVPVHMERGPNGGIVLADDYRRAIAQFTNEELLSLFASTIGPLADLGIAPPVRALQKLAGALPAPQRRAAERSRGRLLVDHNRWYRAEQPTAILAALRKAESDERRVRLRYRDRARTISDRLIDPLGLVAKAGVWYLVARDVEKGYRTFRAERIVEVAVTDETFARPPDFDLDEHWRSSIEQIQRQPETSYECTARVHPDAVERCSLYWNAELLEEGEGFALLRMRAPSREHAVILLLSLGELVFAVEPADICEAIVMTARAALARFEKEAGG